MDHDRPGNLVPSDGQLARLARRIRVALGREPGDLLVTGGRVVNVFTRRIEPADVVIADGRVAAVGRHDWRGGRGSVGGRRGGLPGLFGAPKHPGGARPAPAPRGPPALP